MPRQDTPDEEVVLPMPGRTGVEHARPMLTVLENRLHQLALCRAKGANYFATPPVKGPTGRRGIHLRLLVLVAISGFSSGRSIVNGADSDDLRLIRSKL